MRNSTSFELIALTPPGFTDPSIAIAASRAGALGVLDMQYAHHEPAAQRLLNTLVQHARGRCGVRLDGRAEPFTIRIAADLPTQCAVAILTAPADPESLHRQVRVLRRCQRTILLEATSLAQVRLGEEAEVDGFVAKGHESGGWVGEETSFILLQRFLAHASLPVWVQGGVGLHTASACYAGGAAGVVLDSQLLLTRESTLPEAIKAAIARIDGSETTCLGSEIGMLYRVYARPGASAVDALRHVARTLAQSARPQSEVVAEWQQEVNACVGWGNAARHIWPLGQDATFAAPLAERFQTVGGVLEGIRQEIDVHVRAARTLCPLAEGAPLACAHRTRYPIVQGPMTRVSDTASFAVKVAEAGALPFLALALSRAPQVRKLLEETSHALGSRPWGVGILGFVPIELREEQLEVVRAYRPPFALIAGGRPDQALTLEEVGIPTYLHVPSPALLKMFIEGGARRFVFEGRECGGHVGPRSSFVLWNSMIETILGSLPKAELTACHVLFAGGVHDATSAAMVATMAAPLAEQGARIGVLLGTAYLFTAEAVETGAITRAFQQEAMHCDHTVLVETGPGHAIRCVETPYVETFAREKQRLLAGGQSLEDIRTALEDLNIGRLRIASKGVSRPPGYSQDPAASELVAVSVEEQRSEGMYMIGQLAALRDSTCTIEELHRDVVTEGSARLAGLAEPALARTPERAAERPCDVAIIGMACLLPKASDLRTYWNNILNKVDAITEVPKDRWDWRRYFDADPRARDKIYSKWGGFLDDVPFDPMRYGMPPASLPSIEPLQLLTLEVVRAALEDAGYSRRPFARQCTSVVLGVGGGVAELGARYALRSALPTFMDDVPPDLLARLPEWTEDSFAGLLLNVAAGRVANRFDLGGVNYTVDAACASSLAAVYLAARELEVGTSDVVIAGGVDTVQNPFGYLCFSKTHALSPRGRCRTFDATADGIVISEGLAMLVLKRVADAERDGDRIYAVIKSVAGSSDGRDKGLTAPRPEGQALALNRAYARAGFSPSTVGLVEAHGTGTVAGDEAEVQTLKRVFEAAGATRQGCAIGSVKSMIGHTKCTAGVAGLVKVALALHHKVIPPTLHVEKPNPKASFSESPFYVNTEARPWVHGTDAHPRRAGVSAFGFGGTNFHAVVEEYTGEFMSSAREAVTQPWPSELFLWTGSSRDEILGAITPLEQALARGATPALHDLAYTAHTLQHVADERSGHTLAIVTTSLDDLRQKLRLAREALTASGAVRVDDARGIYFTEEPLARDGKVAFLFPGQGSQHPGMLRDLAIHFPEVRERFELADRVLHHCFPRPLSTYVFPPPWFTPDEERTRQQALNETNIAQPALGAADMGLYHLLRALGVTTDMAAGHSYGEYAALCAAGVFDEETLLRLSEVRGRCIIEAAGNDLGTMAAVEAGPESIANVLQSVEGVWIANLNAPKQTVIAGTRPSVETAVERLRATGVRVNPLSVACAFHSPVVAPARDRLAEYLSTLEFAAPQLAVFSNTSAAPYPRDPNAVVTLLTEHLVRPVEFAREIEAMYQAGARVFVEVGPRSVLTGLTGQILDTRPHLAVAPAGPGRSAITLLQHALGQLAVQGVPVDLGRLFAGRTVRRLNLAALDDDSRGKPLPPTTWLVNGSRATPLHEIVTAGAPAAGTSTREECTARGGVGALASVTAAPTVAPASIAATGNGSSHRSDVPRRSPASSPASSVPIPELLPNSVVQTRARDVASNVTGVRPRHDEVGGIVLQFQQLMDRFLETQQDVMLAYLRRSTASTDSPTSGAATSEVPSDIAVGGITLPDLRSPGPPPTVAEQVSTHERQPPEATSAISARDASSTSAPANSVREPPRATGTGREQLTQQLLQIVSERTGYPPEMLGLDQNIEADLGIDSIKRVEIVGALRRMFLPDDRQMEQAVMDRLGRVKTLDGIVDAIDAIMRPDQVSCVSCPGDPVSRCADQSAPQRADVGAEGEVGIPRFLLTAVDAPLSSGPIRIPAAGVFVITDDERGVAHALAGSIRHQGGRAVLVQLRDENGEVGQDVYAAELTSPTAVAELSDNIRRRQGPIVGLVHLLPLKTGAGCDEMDFASWRARLRQEVKSLYCLAKEVCPDLKRAGEAQGSWLVAATSMGGTFASDSPRTEPISPSQAGVAGMIKTLALEWPQVRSRVVDFDGGTPAPELAARLFAEIATQDNNVEVGYSATRRVVLRTRPVPLDRNNSTRLAIDSSSVVLVTGGARGITAEVARELAERYQPTLLLVGRSALPEREEAPETAGLTSPKALKAVLMDRMRWRGQEITPAPVEAAYSRLLQDREIRSTLAALEQLGATVHYYQADVRDERAFGSLIEEIYRSYGRIDGVVHGAGVIEDRLIDGKLPDSFDRVFDTKVVGAFVLSRTLRSDSLKFLTLFSSVAGRFGNRGQSDYAAANEVLNKLAIHLDGQWRGRVVSINWGPWAKTGMASAEVQRQFAERAVQLIDPQAGRRAFDQELRYGRKGEVEVILGGGPWDSTGPAESMSAPSDFPLLHGVSLSVGDGNLAEAVCRLDPRDHLYLQDHLLDAKPVLPVAVAMELMGEVVQQGWPTWKMVGVRAVRVLKGLVLDNGPESIRVTARQRSQPSPERPEFEVDVEIAEVKQSGYTYYRAAVQLAERLPTPPSYELPVGLRMSKFPMTVDEAYRRWLFHGPRFQCISEIEGIGNSGIIATVVPSSPQHCFASSPANAWLIDPIVLDSGPQLAILWARVYRNMTALPSGIQSYRRYGSLSGSALRCYFQVLPDAGDYTIRANAFFVDSESRLVGLLEGLESVCSRSLNRLAWVPTTSD